MAIRHNTTAPRSSLWNNDHVGNLDDLDDVVISGIADEDLLQYDSGTGNWVNVTGSGFGAVTLADLAALGLVGTIVMSEGITDPPEPVWSEDGTDYIYSEVGQ